MLRLFSAFPNGRPGAGLLLLRVVVGLVAIGHGVQRLSSGVAVSWVGGADLAASIGGVLLIAGCLTPLASVCVAAALVALAASDTLGALTSLLLISNCVALVLLGPGAWSIDARLFGRREILIPRR